MYSDDRYSQNNSISGSSIYGGRGGSGGPIRQSSQNSVSNESTGSSRYQQVVGQSQPHSIYSSKNYSHGTISNHHSVNKLKQKSFFSQDCRLVSKLE